jgi:two-component system cell cycle response regulator DivK
MQTIDTSPSPSYRQAARLNPGTPSGPGPQGDFGRIGASPSAFQPLVLVVDDHEDSRAIARLVLESGGFRVAEARTGFEGFRMAVEMRPTVVLLDMILPGIDGWEIARLLRANADAKGAAIVAVTALASADDRDRALLAGCDEVLTKPVPPASLLNTVRRYVGVLMSSGRAS